jgi:aspartate/glutamate racemase
MRLALLHTGAVNIPTFAALAKEYWGDTEVMNLLDDKIVADLRSDASAASVPGRLIALAQVAAAAGADAVMLTCSSISGLAAATAQAAGIPVLRVDEAMADEAARIGSGGRIAVIATLSTTLVPTVALIRERLELADGSAEFEEVLVEGAFEAVVSGDRASHDALVQEAIRAAAARVDVVVLAQASMLSAAEGVDVAVPVLSSPELGARRAAEVLSLG